MNVQQLWQRVFPRPNGRKISSLSGINAAKKLSFFAEKMYRKKKKKRTNGNCLQGCFVDEDKSPNYMFLRWLPGPLISESTQKLINLCYRSSSGNPECRCYLKASKFGRIDPSRKNYSVFLFRQSSSQTSYLSK